MHRATQAQLLRAREATREKGREVDSALAKADAAAGAKDKSQLDAAARAGELRTLGRRLRDNEQTLWNANKELFARQEALDAATSRGDAATRERDDLLATCERLEKEHE